MPRKQRHRACDRGDRAAKRRHSASSSVQGTGLRHSRHSGRKEAWRKVDAREREGKRVAKKEGLEVA